MPVSPSPDNYTVYKAVIKWKDAQPALATTADITTGSPDATLASDAGLVVGDVYGITGTGIPVGATFAYNGSVDIVMSADASATTPTQAVNIIEDYRHCGNAPEFETTPSVERLDHFSSMTGIRTKDASVVRQKQITCRLVFEEMTPENLAMFLLGELAAPVGPATYSVISIGRRDQINGALRVIGTNEVGEKVQLDYPNVNLAPTGSLNLITDEWGRMEMSGEVLYDTANNRFGTLIAPITAEVAAPVG